MTSIVVLKPHLTDIFCYWQQNFNWKDNRKMICWHAGLVIYCNWHYFDYFALELKEATWEVMKVYRKHTSSSVWVYVTSKFPVSVAAQIYKMGRGREDMSHHSLEATWSLIKLKEYIQTFTVLSNEADKRNWSQHKTDITTSVCPDRVCKHCKLSRFHTYT